jgi:hypothetical protein
MEINIKGALFLIILVFGGFILSAGCVGDNTLPASSDSDENSKDVYALETEVEENETGYEESYNTMDSGGILDKSEGYYNEEYASDAYVNQVTVKSPDETGDSDDEYDYAIESNSGKMGGQSSGFH